MKKVYLIASAVSLSAFSFGQVNRTFMNQGKNYLQKATNTVVEKNNSFEKAGGDVIFSETFNGSMDGTNAWDTTGVNSTVWKWDSDGPSGQYSSATQKITSPTAANGFMIFDTDEFNETTTSGDVETTGNLVSPVINLTGKPGAIIEFYSAYRSCCNNDFYPKIEVSTDGFTTVKEYDVTIDGIGVNDNSGTKLVSINITDFIATATNLNNFQFRFVWTSASHYFWQVDDISVKECYDYDVSLYKFWLNDISNGYEHTEIPQDFAGTLTVQGVIKNKGYQAIPNSTKLVVTVFNTTTGAQVATETGGTLLNGGQIIGDTITFETAIDLHALPVANYSVRADLQTTETDNNLQNDSLRRSLNITNFFLGQENFEAPKAVESIGNSYVSGTGSGYMTVGNIMSIPANATNTTLHGFEISLAKNSSFPITAGTDIEVKIYEMNPAATTIDEYFVDLGESRYFTVQSADIPTANNTVKKVLFNFHKSTTAPGAYTLEAGKDYYIAFNHVGNATTHFAYAVNQGDDDRSSWIYGPYSANDGNDHWFINGTQVLTRLSFDQSLGLETVTNNSLTFSNVYPNPTTGSSIVNYSLANASEVSINVVDVAGKVVYSSVEGNKVAGKHTANIDATTFNAGVYYVTITTNDSQLTQKLIKK